MDANARKDLALGRVAEPSGCAAVAAAETFEKLFGPPSAEDWGRAVSLIALLMLWRMSGNADDGRVRERLRALALQGPRLLV